MLQSNVRMGNFITQLKSIIKSMVIKRNKVADIFETSLENKKASDRYINTIDYGDYWESYVKFDSDVLLNAGLDPNSISWYLDNKDNIPREVRAKVIELQKEKILTSYVELNDYYRMLNGKPPIADTQADWIYIPKNSYGIPTDIPIHELSTEYVGFLRSNGTLDNIIANNPTKGYLNYLADRSIDIYSARTANNFDILYINSTNVDTIILNDFRKFYDISRTYYMNGIYNTTYSDMFVWYDEFIGICILIMAVQRLISNIYKQGLTRDFYDVELIKFLFKSYSVPYIEDMDLKYQLSLAKNLNYLLQYKSTDKVLYNIASIIGFYDINIYKYYMVKTHRLDNELKPIFKYTEEVQPDGTIVKTPVYDMMYNFHFQRVNLKEKDINTALTDNRNKMDYYTITSEDPYWTDDDELKQKLYEENFNNIITKYMSLDVAYKIVEMMYEVSVTLRMFIDNQKDFRLITINVPKITTYDIPLYDLTIFLCTLGAKKMGLKGSIPIKPYQIASVYGFNFKADLIRLRDEIYNNEGEFTKIDPELVKYILNMRAVELNDVDRLYTNITALRKIITRAIFLTKDKETYFQYVKLYKSLMLVEDVESLYKDSEGNIEDTYEGLLARLNPDLYSIYLTICENPNSIDSYIDSIYIKLATLSNEYKYLASINRNENLFEFVMKLIRFFKSYTVDFVNSGIQYYLDDRYLMAFKLLDENRNVDVEEVLKDSIYNKGRYYKDYIDRMNVGLRITDEFNLLDWNFIRNKIRYYDSLTLLDKLRIDVNQTVEDRERLIDEAYHTLSELKIFNKENTIGLRDDLFVNMIELEYTVKENGILKEEIRNSEVIEPNIRTDIRMIDEVNLASSNQKIRDGLYLKDRVKITISEG